MWFRLIILFYCKSEPGKMVRTRKPLFLIGHEISDITGNKLPTKRQVLQFCMHNLHGDHKKVTKSAYAVYLKVMDFWNRARIPTLARSNTIKKITSIYEKWRNICRHVKRKSKKQKLVEENFDATIDELFDIASKNILQLMTNEDDRAFLIAQRSKGRPGRMTSVDTILAKKERRLLERAEKRQKYFRKVREQEEKLKRTGKVKQSSSSSETEKNSKAESSSSESGKKKRKKAALSLPSSQLRKRTRLNLNPKLVAILDRTGVSTRAATSILAATAASSSSGENIEQKFLSKSALHRNRRKIREQENAIIKRDFEVSSPLVVHWDGKLMKNLTGNEKNDRLAILVTGSRVEKLLHVPALKTGTGLSQCEAVYETLNDWNLCDHVSAMSFGTTAVNTGKHRGTCTVLEKKLGKSLLYLACRHHVLELILGTIFCCCLGGTKSPQEEMFKKFQEYWPKIDVKKCSTSSKDQRAHAQLKEDRDNIALFATNQLNEFQPREDYKELLELVLIFFDRPPKKNMAFKIPGSFSHARWMSKAIYSLKIWLFRDQFTLTEPQKAGLREICLFICKIYIFFWYNQASVSPPSNDLFLIKKLVVQKGKQRHFASRS